MFRGLRRRLLTAPLWGEPQLAALGAVRAFLDATDHHPRERDRLIRLARAAHAALYRVEVAYFIDDAKPWEHP